MFHNLIASSESSGVIFKIVEYAASGLEILAVLIIVLVILYAVIHYSIITIVTKKRENTYHELRTVLGRGLLLGLEILVAADIIRTVALDATIESILVLGLLVLVRTFLSWSIVVETEGRWPWQGKLDA